MKKTLSILLCALCLAASPVFAQQNVEVTGRVTSAEDGQPMSAVVVTVAGTSIGVATIADGSYSIGAAAGATLQFSFLGMKTQERIVPDASSAIINVEMEPESTELDDVVVIAYGTRKKGTIAGSVGVVKAEAINNVPAASFDQALQGQTPGLTVTSFSGQPGAAASFQIRGVNSINSGTEPLFILDGMPISSTDFNAINPNDIESVSVLKDASSTSIYGARAANGVIVVTSKRGRIGDKGRVVFNTQLGFSNLAYGKWDMMNTPERIAFEKEVGIDGGKNYEIISKTDVDWRKMVYNNNAPLRNYDLSVSGASPVFNYFVSGSYYRQEGVALGSDFKRYTVRANLEARVSKWLRIGTQTNVSSDAMRQAIEGAYYTNTPISAAFFMLPYWNPYTSNGSVASLKDGSWLGSGENPIEWLENNPSESKRQKVMSTVYAEITPVKGLTLKSSGSLDFTNDKGSSTTYPSYVTNQGFGGYGLSSGRGTNLTWTNTANYMFDLTSGHSFNFMLGHEMIDSRVESFQVQGRGQNNDRLMMLSTSTMMSGWADSYGQSAYLSFFLRGEYNYKGKYYAEFAVRRESSSKFGANHRWGNFWSAGLMWDMRKENFVANASDWLTNAQVSFSIGTSGNSSIPAFDHLALVGGGPQYNGTAGIAPVSLGNPDLTWERLLTANIGFHFGFWNRLDIDLELYNKNTTDMLMEVPQSYATGFGTNWDNIGAMVNRGVELAINGRIIQTKDFVWSAFANISYNQDRITQLYHGRDVHEVATSGLRLEVGKSSKAFYVVRYAGVNPANGEQLWYTRDGELTNEYNENDKVMTGQTYNAPWQGGFGTSFSWKGLSLSAMFTWMADKWIMNNDRYWSENSSNAQYNLSRKMLYDRWKNPGDITDIPKFGSTVYFDSHLLEDASFLRLKNLTLSYTLPAKWMEATRFFESIRIYGQAQNLWTLTKFQGMDPEYDLNMYKAIYPMSRQFTFGLEVTF